MATYIRLVRGTTKARQTLTANATYHCAAASHMGTSAADSGESHASKAAIANFLQDLESVLQRNHVGAMGGRPAMGQIVCNSHF